MGEAVEAPVAAEEVTHTRWKKKRHGSCPFSNQMGTGMRGH